MLNKQERQVIKLELSKEQKVLDDLERQYKKALRDIDDKIRMLQSDELTKSRIYQIQYQQALRGQVAGILDELQGDEFATIQQYLHESYQDGFIGTMYSIHGQGIPLIVPLDQDAAVKAIITDSKISEGLYKHLGVNVKQLKQAIRSEITRGIASNMPFADIARNISNRSKASLGRAKTIVRTESHRISEAAAADARNAAKERGCDVVKQWDGTLDGDTRPTHRRLDGQIRETDEPFEMDGKTAMQPGDFGKPEEDCNCRCVALTRAKWALDEDELKTLKERADYFELDKAKDFEDFKNKYLKAAQMLETPSETGQLATPYSQRGVKIEERLQEYLNELHADGDYIVRPAGEIKYQDLAILTTESGVEYTTMTIGKRSYLIRGAENRTTIKQELLDMLVKNKGTLDCHSHPYVGDLVPSASDKKFLELLPWQEESAIIEPGQNAIRFNHKGVTGSLRIEDKRDDNYYQFMFGEGD